MSVLYCKASDKWLIQLLNGRMGNRWRKSTTNVLCLMLVVHLVSNQVVHSEFEQPGNCWKYDNICLIMMLIYTLNKFGLVVPKFWCSIFFYLHKSKMAAIFTYQIIKNCHLIPWIWYWSITKLSTWKTTAKMESEP